MDAEGLDYLLVPVGMLVIIVYHSWLIFTVRCHPRRTVIGINSETRRQWVDAIMADTLKNGVLAVQTIRNSMMASTLLATTAITLTSLMMVFITSGTPRVANVPVSRGTSDADNASKASSGISLKPVYGNTSSFISSIKYFSILLCFFVAFLCNVQSIRYYAHGSFLTTVPTHQGNRDYIEYVALSLHKGSLFWSIGLRAFYISFPLFLWLFGPVPMFVCSCIMCVVLYFLDTTSSFTQQLHTGSFSEERSANDVESAVAPSYANYNVCACAFAQVLLVMKIIFWLKLWRHCE